MTYSFVSWEEDGIWSAHSPSVPGVYGIGDTAKEAEEDLMDALEALSSYLSTLGEHLPSSRKVHTGQIRI